MTVRNLEEVRPKPDEDVVAMLEEALEEAKQGNLRSVVILGYKGDRTVTWWRSELDARELVGHLEFMKIKAIMED